MTPSRSPGIFGRLKAWLRKTATGEVSATKLLGQYWRSLNIWLLQFEARSSGGSSPALDKLRELLKGTPDWQTAFEADMLIPQLVQGPEIETEFLSKLEEAKREWPKDTAEQQSGYRTRWDSLTAEPEKRALLQDLTRQGLWHYAVMDQVRCYRTTTMLHSALLFSASLFSLFVAFALVDRAALDPRSWSGIWWMIALGGWAGASFSWLSRMRDALKTTDLEVLKEISRFPYALFRTATGVGGAFVLYWALRGGFVTGAMFPVLDASRSPERMTQLTQAFRALAETASWCAPAESEKGRREALLAASVEHFRALVAVHERTSLHGAGGGRPEQLDYKDREWLIRAGLRPPVASPAAGTLPICDSKPPVAIGEYTIHHALFAPAGTLALLMFWSFVAGFSEKLVPSILDRAGDAASTGRGS